MNLYSIMKGWEAVEVRGPEAKDFLQRLTTVDLRRFEPGQWADGTYLQANGKLIFPFKIFRLQSEAYLLLVPPGLEGASPSQAAFEALEKLHFMEKLTITPLGDAWSYARALSEQKVAAKELFDLAEKPAAAAQAKVFFTGPAGGTAEPFWLVFDEDAWSLAPIAADLGIVFRTEVTARIVTALEEAEFSRADSLEPYRVRAGSPAYGHELGASTNPLEAGLEEAVHQNKGCYPGQEVIERIRAMGQVPRKLMRVEGTGPLPLVPQPILAEDDGKTAQEAGTLTSATVDPFDSNRWIGLGIVKRLFANPTTSSRMKAAGQAIDLKLK